MNQWGLNSQKNHQINDPTGGWITEQVFHTGEAFFTDLCEHLLGAQTSIDLETYIFQNDALGDRIAAALGVAAKTRGVLVRVLVDGFGSPTFIRHYQQKLTLAGVQTKIYHPLGLKSLNRRNHRKVCLIDDAMAWIGSMNVSGLHLDHTSSRGHSTKQWRDTGARVSGHQVKLFKWAFDQAWGSARVWQMGLTPRSLNRTLYQELQQKNKLLVRLNWTHRLRRHRNTELVQRIRQAQRRVWITTPYFVPPLRLLRALRARPRAGGELNIDIRILLPHKSDVFFSRWVSTLFFKILLKAGVRIFEYKPSFLHAKTLLIDDWATVGSSNMNYRSFFHDLEADVVLTQSQSILSLETQFEKDLMQSREITLESWGRRPWYHYVTDLIAHFFGILRRYM